MVRLGHVWNFTSGDWNDGTWGQEELSDLCRLVYVGPLVFAFNIGSETVTTTLPFPVFGDQAISIRPGGYTVRLRKEEQDA